MPNLRNTLVFAIAFGLALGLAGCKSQPPEVDTTPKPPTPVVEPEPAPPPVEVEEDFPEERAAPIVEPEPSIEDLNNRLKPLKTVYFDFDKYDLSDETRATLRDNARWLKDNAKYRAVVQGHCDERGTIEYTLALGERRANAVREYLTSLGLSRSRLRIVTYGEERPADPRHTESAWALNRRAEFLIEN